MPREALHARPRREPQRVLPHVKTLAVAASAFISGLMLQHLPAIIVASIPTMMNQQSIKTTVLADANLADHSLPQKDIPGDLRFGSGAGASLASATTVLLTTLLTISVGLLIHITLRRDRKSVV